MELMGSCIYQRERCCERCGCKDSMDFSILLHRWFPMCAFSTIRGSGRQKIGAFVCLGSYYLVGIRSSILLGFVCHSGVKGLWIGNICAIFVQDVVLLIMAILTDWEKQVTKAMERVQSTEEPSKVLESDSNYRILRLHAATSFLSIRTDPSE